MKPSNYQLEETIYLAGEALRVAGIARLELADGSLAIRYLLVDAGGAAQILEERGGQYAVLKQFSPSAAPEPSGNELSVMGVRYVLRGVDKLNVLGTLGAPVGAAPPAGLLLSGRFEGETALILREFAPGGTAVQSFYTVKRLAAGELLDSRQHAEAMQTQLASVQRQAAAQAESGDAGGWVVRIGAAIVAVLVAVLLAYACTAEKRLSSAGPLHSIHG
ncbi:MAG: hypothetical protein AB7O31_07200 [Burkholderiales bacterium]